MRIRSSVSPLILGAVLLPLSLVSCGGGSSDPNKLSSEAAAAAGSGNYQGALDGYRKALAGLDASDPIYLRAKMGEVGALVHLDPDAAQETFLALGSQVGEKDYRKVGGDLTSAGHFGQAINVLDAGMKKFPESPSIKEMLEVVKAEAEKTGDSAALKQLEGLGYL